MSNHCLNHSCCHFYQYSNVSESLCNNYNCPPPLKCDNKTDQCYYIPPQADDTGPACNKHTCHQPFRCDLKQDKCYWTPTTPVILSTQPTPICNENSCPRPYTCDERLNACYLDATPTTSSTTFTTTPTSTQNTTDQYIDSTADHRERECNAENCQYPFQCDPVTDLCYFIPPTEHPPVTPACSPLNCPPPFRCDPKDGLCKYMHDKDKWCKKEKCPRPFHCDRETEQCLFTPPRNLTNPDNLPCNRHTCPRPYQCDQQGLNCLFLPKGCEDEQCPPPFACDFGFCVYRPPPSADGKKRRCDKRTCERPSYCDKLRDLCVYVEPDTIATETPGTTPACSLRNCPPPFKCDPKDMKCKYTDLRATTPIHDTIIGCHKYCRYPFQCDRQERCVFLERKVVISSPGGQACNAEWCQFPAACNRTTGQCEWIDVKIKPDPYEPVTLPTYVSKVRCTNSWCKPPYECNKEGVCLKEEIEVVPPPPLPIPIPPTCGSSWCVEPHHCDNAGECVDDHGSRIRPPILPPKPQRCADWCQEPLSCNQFERCIKTTLLTQRPPRKYKKKQVKS
ncbi:unnamed protein product [Acanthoscelides obtectus]|uniref:Uncharacterized protein n=1 Tax=Acanthoscelides obtectus TaxID=200917 RepID=A0A9P0QEC4_ACAOB|nr:unnamed protein product [Acanthoscelides obtectus]CAK1658919.1 hypothetical protein AOBTE_LOCUS21202 [Acanthoscelides obtectus]